MQEKILVPLDGSRVGEAAVPLVEEIISKLSPEVKVEVALLQVVSSLAHWVVVGETGARIPYSQAEIDTLKRESLKYLNSVAERLKPTGAAIKVEARTGAAAEEILKAADEMQADLIAMSTHGMSGLGRWAFGSVTGRVLRAATRPVLTVRAKPPEPANA